MRLTVIASFLIISSVEHAASQNAYVRLGQQAYIDGNFKAAIKQLEKGCLIDSTDANALWMLGYSYYHSDNLPKSVTAFTKEIAIAPNDAAAYYYRAMAKYRLGKGSQLQADREKHLLGSIFDFTKAINLSPTDTKIASFFQNRAIAYRDYGMFKLETAAKPYDRARGLNSLRAAMNDLQKVLDSDPGRSDIASLFEVTKEKLATANGHH
ncbi:tetratricopeptide repeat protein [Mucilaginibacter sp. HD30]